MNLYIANHLHHLEEEVDDDNQEPDFVAKTGTDKPVKLRRLPEPESTALIETLLAHATQPKYLLSVDWRDPGDVVCWDNTAVLHRAGPGTFTGKYKRDMRRTTVHDDSDFAWGLNDKTTARSGLP